VADAVQRTLESDTAAFAVIVDAKDDSALGFYERLQFVPIAGDRNRLFLPVAFFAKLMSAK
jgi:hypothetical protein